MTDGAGGGEERDLFERWLAHRDGGAVGSEGRASSAAVPPAWAPRVTAPAPDPVESPAESPAEVAEPAAEPAAEPVAEPVDEARPVGHHAPQHAAEPVAEPAIVPAMEPAMEAAMEAVAEPVAESLAEPVAATATALADPAPAAVEERRVAPAIPSPRTGAEDDAVAPSRPRLGRPGRKQQGEEPPLRHTFRPRTRARRAVGVGLMLAAAAAVVGVYVASRERDTASIGIAGTLWVLTGIIWAVHSGTSVTRISVRGGQLDVLRQGVRTTVDLTSNYTPVELHGRPGRPGWRVDFRRRDLTTFTIDGSMVDPVEFMRVLRYYRPGIDAPTDATDD